MYSYTISKEPNNALFLKVCNTIEKHFCQATKDEMLTDVDGTCVQIYRLPDGVIKVCNDYEVYALYVDSNVDLKRLFF